MTFLNPLALFGLAAAALPLLIHLLNLRKLKTVDFSSLRFLKELQKSTMRRIRLRQWLLLVLRTLLVVFLVLAFARPATRSSIPAFAGGRATTSVILLLDDSPSMTIRNENGIVFDQAKDGARSILSTVDPGDRVYLVKFSDIREGEPVPPFMLPSGAVSVLKASTPSQRRVPYRSAFRVARAILAQSQAANREVYLVTDGQQTEITGSAQQADTVAINDPTVRLYLVIVPSPQEENLSISSLDIRSRILAEGKPSTIQAVVQNFGENAVSNSVASLFLDGSRVAQQSLDIPSRATQSVTFNATPHRRGNLSGILQLEEDALDIDNQFFYTLPVPEHMRVVTSAGSPVEAKYVNLALTLRGDSSHAGVYGMTFASEDRLPAVDLNSTDVLILCGARTLSKTMATQIKDFVEEGRGVILFPPPDGNLQVMNDVLLPALGIPLLRTEPRTAQDSVAGAPSSTFFSFSSIDFDHPLFAGMFEHQSGRLQAPPEVESPRIRRAVSAALASRAVPIIRLSDGRPFLVEYRVGKGRVLLFTVEAGVSWSDFPVKGLFAPLLYRAVAYLATGKEEATPVRVGEPLLLSAKISSEVQGKQFILRAPSGIDERLVPTGLSASGVASFRSEKTDEAGVYSLFAVDAARKTTTPLQAGVVNIAPEESDLRKATEQDWKGLWSSIEVTPEQTRTLVTTAPVEAAIHESRFGVELWKIFLILAIACAFAEMMLGRQKSGQEEPSEGRIRATA